MTIEKLPSGSYRIRKMYHCIFYKQNISWILQTKSAYAIMPLGKDNMSKGSKRTNPRKYCEYFRGFFFFFGEVNRLG